MNHINYARRKKNGPIKRFLSKALYFITGVIEVLKSQLANIRSCLGDKKMYEADRKWTGSIIDLVELIYGLDEMKSINNGDIPIQELAFYFSQLLNIEIKDCYSAYVDMKRRKNVSRTYFLDKMSERLNQRMQRDDAADYRKK